MHDYAHDTYYLVAPWHWLGVLFFVGMGVAAFLSVVLRRRRDWSGRRRLLTSASITPFLLVLMSLLGWLSSSPGADGWDDLVGVLWLTIALGGGAIAFVGGLAGAAAIAWYRRA